ncbi:MAG: type III-B CRISPR module RAMP protein Cmr1 [Thermodesulfobacteriota bacterium]|nr:type III-B CRISPR module RAMP protein Cmr1 [Thermodesulfobacteriota bacterium]
MMNFAQRILDRKTSVFDVEFVTPAFALGADGEHAELREQTINGLLRFWWRAFFGSDDLDKMQKDESAIFGSTSNRSDLKIFISNRNYSSRIENIPRGELIPVRSKGSTFNISILEYLSYGLYDYERGNGNVFKKGHIKENGRFSLTLSCSKKNEKKILTALFLLSKFGGIGSRSRNGFGSMQIKNFDSSQITTEFDETLKSFTAFSHKAKIFKFQPENSWSRALSKIGIAYREARTRLEPRHMFDRRALASKPIIVRNEINISERHSKSYFLKVVKTKDNQFQGQILYLPYNYYRPDERDRYFNVYDDMNNFIHSQCLTEQSIKEALNDN